MTDITVHCQGTKIELHKIVVCAQSLVLYKAFTNGFKVCIEDLTLFDTNFYLQESNMNDYQTDDDEPLLFTKMIDYFYTGDYDDTGLENEGDSQSLLDFHAKIFALADKYDVELLQKRAVDHYKSRLNNCDIFEFLQSISVVYESTPSSLRSLRDIVIHYAKTKLQRIACKQEDVKEAFLDVVKDTPEFAMDVCADWIGSTFRGTCSSCGPWQPVEVLQARCLSCGKGNASVFKRFGTN
jgi:BTB/POZ domain